MIVEKFREETTENHWNNERLEGYIYKDVFDTKFFNILKDCIENTFSSSSTLTFLTHNTIFSINDKTKKIVSHNQNGREQHVMFDLFFEDDYMYQTPDTIKDWGTNVCRSKLSPILFKTIDHFSNSEPFTDEKDKWLCTRMHLNVLKYSKCLSLHFDGGHIMFNTSSGNHARALSITVYLEDHIEGYGGELFSVNGFLFKPKQNSAIGINGNKVLHGVNMNMKPDKKTRLAFTMRFAHIDDLYLPGHPSKFLYHSHD